VLVLDEPTSSLDESEVERCSRAAPAARRGHGDPVRHALPRADVRDRDRITVLRNGERVGEYLKADLPPAALIAAMVGRELSAAVAAAHAPAAPARRPRAASARARRRGQLQPVDVTLRRGEVVGVGGLLGSGRTELARLLFGSSAATAASCSWRRGGAPATPGAGDPPRPGDVPGGPQADGIVGELSVRENIVLALQARLGVLALPARAADRRDRRALRAALGIKAADLDDADRAAVGRQPAEGGARALARDRAALLILDEPTRGIDVGRQAGDHERDPAAGARRLAVLFISSEMDEVVRVSDRIVGAARPPQGRRAAGGSSEQAVYHMIAAESVSRRCAELPRTAALAVRDAACCCWRERRFNPASGSCSGATGTCTAA
jgi:simple sugar transport system ATP-binding protein